ncbi:MAG: hypothetical protein ACOWWR_02140 [Eubacteriales bacterium]
MRVDKVNTFYKEQNVVKNDSKVIPFNEGEISETPEPLKEVMQKQSNQLDKIQIDSLKGHIVSTLALDGEMPQEGAESTLYKLLLDISEEKPLLLPSRLDVLDNGSVNITDKDGNVVSILNLEKLLDCQNNEILLEQEIVNFNKKNSDHHPSIIHLKFITDQPANELKENIHSIYGKILKNVIQILQDSPWKNEIIHLNEVMHVDQDTPIASGLRLLEGKESIEIQSLVRIIEESIERTSPTKNTLFVKLLNEAEGVLTINGKVMEKHHNLLDYLFNRNLPVEHPTFKSYDPIGGIQYEIFLLDDLSKTLAIDVPGIGILLLEEKNLRKIMYHLPQIASLYNQTTINPWFTLSLFKHFNWKIIMIILLVLLFVSLLLQ